MFARIALIFLILGIASAQTLYSMPPGVKQINARSINITASSDAYEGEGSLYYLRDSKTVRLHMKTFAYEAFVIGDQNGLTLYEIQGDGRCSKVNSDDFGALLSCSPWMQRKDGENTIYRQECVREEFGMPISKDVHFVTTTTDGIIEVKSNITLSLVNTNFELTYDLSKVQTDSTPSSGDLTPPPPCG